MRSLVGGFALAVGILAATNAHADPIPCFGAWFAVPFVDGPAVCGDVFFGGTDLNGQPVAMTVNPASHEQNGSGVVVGGAGAGGGAFGVVAANGTFGELHAFGSANMDSPAPGASFDPNAWVRAEGSIGYVDGFTVTTTRTVRITSSIGGGFSGVSQADVDFFLQENAPSGAWGQYGIILDGEANAFVYPGSPSSTYVRDLVLTPGDYTFRWSMRILAGAGFSGGSYPSSIADVAHTGRLYFDPMTPGEPLSFLSGHDYVPEPETGTMLLSGLAWIGRLARRRAAFDGRVR
jgi:hypothetical protein